MLLFHCTKDASTALSSTRNGVTHSWVNDQPLPAGGTPWIWQLHAVKIMRQTIIVAMHADSRFAMVFWGVKKGNGETLLQLFFERLANHLFWLAEDTGALDESGCETMFNRLMTTHHAFRFHTNSDRSVQAHINEVVQCCRNAVADNGCLPDNYEEAAGFEQDLNRMIRSAHGGDYFYPNEALLRACLRDFAGFHESQLRNVSERIQDARKQNLKRTVLQYVETKGY